MNDEPEVSSMPMSLLLRCRRSLASPRHTQGPTPHHPGTNNNHTIIIMNLLAALKILLKAKSKKAVDDIFVEGFEHRNRDVTPERALAVTTNFPREGQVISTDEATLVPYRALELEPEAECHPRRGGGGG